MDANERLHHEWLGMAQPDGLVVTPSALKAAEANITWPVTEEQAALKELAGEGKVVLDLGAFLREILAWSDDYLVEGDNIPESLRVQLEGGEALTPTFALRSADNPDEHVVLVMQVAWRIDLDAATDDKRWTATAHQRFERLLRDTGVHAGLLSNGKVFRLVYAPKGESAGWITFRLEHLLDVSGRPLLGAMHMLLNERRLLSLEESKRLSGLLRSSREYQNTVSNRLREQILSALRELLVGFQHADRVAGGAILRDYRAEARQEIYSGLVTVLMRMVFVLYAEERGLLPMDHDLYASAYSLSRLHAQLREDRDRYGDTINDRYGAWARVISLFRLLHDGVVAADGLVVPARKGDFFDPDAFPFLEGRPRGVARQLGEKLDLPRVSDGVVFRVLDQLVVLDGERLQYRGLDVEQIGSVYEGLMGFELEIAEGDSLALMPDHVVVNLEVLLRLPGPERLKHLKAVANLDAKDKAAGDVKAAKTVAELQAALARRVSSRQPGLIATGSLFLQPGEERRRTGSHYTPRSLTQPIVETTLRPVLEKLGPDVKPEQILDLKICDPAMGSGAFLVEACRQLADHLVAAWRRTGTIPELPKDEDPVLHARRLIAQKCLYGVDKNPLAVDLARLSLWLVTFAREHPFTFVDHALRHGDSLVGLSREQIQSFALDTSKGTQVEIIRKVVSDAVTRADELRDQIHAIGDPPDTKQLEELWRDTNDVLATVRTLGDLIVATFFSEQSDKARKRALDALVPKVQAWLATGAYEPELKGLVADLREGEKPVPPFHWGIEFPEVFGREKPGFDCFVGNPPFLGGTTIATRMSLRYHYVLMALHAVTLGNADLVSFFLRRCFALLRRGGTFGLIATNSIAQGDTRVASLQYVRENGATIYEATQRYPWPGESAVIVTILHVSKGPANPIILNGRSVDRITAFLFHRGRDDAPAALRANERRASCGSQIMGAGFVFEERPTQGSSSLAELAALIAKDPANREVINPFMGGEEFNSSPTLSPSRRIINFGQMTYEEARGWPDVLAIVEAKVKPMRLGNKQRNYRDEWWIHASYSHEAVAFLVKRNRMLVLSQVSAHLATAFVGRGAVYAKTLVLLLFHTDAAFSVVQSRVHELWVRFAGSSMKDDLRYTPSDCFDTYPFPPGLFAAEDGDERAVQLPTLQALHSIGQRYHADRAALMLARQEGLTKTYNRFHDHDEHSPDIVKLRDLHAQMDRAVLDAYGWTDINPVYDFREQLDESIRLTWDDDTRDEVLARLLELNRVMAAKEAEEAVKADCGTTAPKKKRASKGRRKKDEGTGSLFGDKERDE
jgi:hypothetical protein